MPPPPGWLLSYPSLQTRDGVRGSQWVGQPGSLGRDPTDGGGTGLGAAHDLGLLPGSPLLTLALGSLISRSGSVSRAEFGVPFLFLGIVSVSVSISVSSSIRLQGKISCSCGDQGTGGARERETVLNFLPSTQLRPVNRRPPAQRFPSAKGWKRYLKRVGGGARLLALPKPPSPPSRSRAATGAPLRSLTSAAAATTTLGPLRRAGV